MMCGWPGYRVLFFFFLFDGLAYHLTLELRLAKLLKRVLNEFSNSVFFFFLFLFLPFFFLDCLYNDFIASDQARSLLSCLRNASLSG